MKKTLLALLMCISIAATAQTCILKRDANGNIARSTAAVNAFKKANPCPATGKASTASCPGYIVDHVQPLCACGADAPSNMQWQTVADAKKKDAEERRQCRAVRALARPWATYQ